VTGGSRLPWYGCPRCTANLGAFRVPATWRSSGSSTGPSRATVMSRGVSGACRPPRPKRRRCWPSVRRAKRSASSCTSWSNGATTRSRPRSARRCCATRRRRSVASCSVGGPRPGAQRRWWRGERLLEEAPRGRRPSLPSARPTSSSSRWTAAARTDFAKARGWAARLRERFSGSPQDPQLRGHRERARRGRHMYHTARLEDARRRFAALTEPRTRSPVGGRGTSSRSTLFRIGSSGRGARAVGRLQGGLWRGCGLARAYTFTPRI